MENVKNLQAKYSEGLESILRINKACNVIEINWVRNKERGTFKKFWNELVPELKEQGIEYIVLNDNNDHDRDIWGEYGFMGRKNDSHQRFKYIGEGTEYVKDHLCAIGFSSAKFLEVEELETFLEPMMFEVNIKNLIRDKAIIESIDSGWTEL